METRSVRCTVYTTCRISLVECNMSNRFLSTAMTRSSSASVRKQGLKHDFVGDMKRSFTNVLFRHAAGQEPIPSHRSRKCASRQVPFTRRQRARSRNPKSSRTHGSVQVNWLAWIRISEVVWSVDKSQRVQQKHGSGEQDEN